jgi:hypothetical protein
MPEDVRRGVAKLDFRPDTGEPKRIRFVNRVRMLELSAKLLV